MIGCVYHSVDIDGWMSAYLVKKHTDCQVCVGYDYSDPVGKIEALLDKLAPCSTIYMVDVTLPDWAMEQIAPRVLWYDHHKTAIEREAAWKSVLCENHSSETYNGVHMGACALVWAAFGDRNELPVVDMIARYDTWNYLPGDDIAKFATYCYDLGESLFLGEHTEVMDRLTSWDPDALAAAITEGGVLMKYTARQYANEARSAAYITTIFGKKVVIAMRPKCSSVFFDSICATNPDIAIRILVKYSWETGNYAVSLFGEGALELLKQITTIVTTLNHGGHPSACGMTLEPYWFGQFSNYLRG